MSYKNILWLVGGIPKKGDKLELPKRYYHNIKSYIFGKNKIFFKKKFKNKIYFQTFDNLEETLKKIILDINFTKQKNINILFSPAAASFDQFKNFEHRGEYFNYLINKIKFIKKINVQ
jgi:UDP-N-acetylmuramoylalanine--D-glutamate ligase